jgi:hypothetical protein
MIFETKKHQKLPASSLIDRAVYDKTECTLTIFFETGGIYLYKDVPSNIANGLKHNKSAGSYFCNNIRGKFKTQRLEPRMMMD